MTRFMHQCGAAVQFLLWVSVWVVLLAALVA